MKSIVYVGMDVHKESFTLCIYEIEKDRIEYYQKLEAESRQDNQSGEFSFTKVVGGIRASIHERTPHRWRQEISGDTSTDRRFQSTPPHRWRPCI